MTLAYSEITQSIEDLLNKDYDFDKCRLEIKSKKTKGIVNSTPIYGYQNFDLKIDKTDSGALEPNLTSYFDDKKNGIHLTNTLTNDKTNIKIQVIDKIIKGLKIESHSDNFYDSALEYHIWINIQYEFEFFIPDKEYPYSYISRFYWWSIYFQRFDF